MACENEDYSEFIQKCDGIPLHALRISARKVLAKYLDPEGSIVEDYCNDYNGLAELAGFDLLDIRGLNKDKTSPTEQLLFVWGNRSDLNPTCDRLVQFLLQLHRQDVLTDCRRLILKDIENYKGRYTGNDEPQDPGRFRPPPTCPSNPVVKEPTFQIYSVDEAIKAQTSDVTTHYWDAFVIYNPEGKDLKFVKQMADILEGPTYNLKLFIPWRDDLPGGDRHEVSADLIEKRCRRAIVILSTDFHKSSVADFQLKFAHCLSPGARSKKVVPIRINMCSIPNILRIVALCDFTKTETIEWAWPRVAAVIKCPLDPSPEQYQVDYEQLKDIKLDTSSSIPREFWALSVACIPFPDPE